MSNNETQRGYPLPSPDNIAYDDAKRIRDAILLISDDMTELDERDASEAQRGNVRLATPAEAGAGTALDRVPAVKRVKDMISAAITAFQEIVAEQIGDAEADLDGEIDALQEALVAAIALKAPLANPTFSGAPRAPTPAAGDSSTVLSTTEFVSIAVGAIAAAMRTRRVGTTVLVNQSTPIADTLVEDGASYSATAYPELFGKLVRYGTVTFAAGNIVNWPGHTLKNNDPVKFVLTTAGNMPSGVTAGTVYYVRNAAAGTIQLATSPGGSGVTTGTNAAGTIRAINAPHGCANDLSTFNVPNSLGEFFRMWDGGRGADANRAFGAAQTHMYEDHIHQVTGGQAYVVYIPGGGGSLDGTTMNLSTTGSTGYASGGTKGSETRPRNVVKLPCIYYQ